jgi:N-acetylneuraminate synthase/N,N'-diacetyllegionaminate synthase
MEIIAEIGQNHNGDMNIAVELIYSAKENGADVVKFQIYDAKKLFPKENNPWYEYNCRTELTMDQVYRLADEAKKVDIEFMASVFDVEKISWLEDIGVKRYKIASRSINDKDLINALCSTKKPLIISLGHWNENEFPRIQAIQQIDFLYCVPKYPTPLEDVKLGSVDFTKFAGFSDHTIGITAALAAFSRGARILEKHFTLDKKMFGPDHSGSMDPGDLKIISNFRDELTRCL